MYSDLFKDLVKFSMNGMNKFYCEHKSSTPNPFYIGFGNPNTEILIIGKEKGFNEENIAQLILESCNNPIEWNNIVILNNAYSNFQAEKSRDYISVFYPYSFPMPPGHTWSKYQKLIDRIYTIDKNDVENTFLEHTFICEVNHCPSRRSKGAFLITPERESLLKHDFYKSFKITILACGNYLNDSEIEKIFDVRKCSNISENISESRSRRKLVVYRNNDRLLINTRQLSFDVSNEYLKEISVKAKQHLSSLQ